ncbi:MAG: hypothetical protein IPM64_07325 [Phycisphaerales bacterium]|nr:hypothetical protein [Phycisphaerales bacterium]
MKRMHLGLIAGLVAGLALLPTSLAQSEELITEDGVITGTMEIDFKTRTNPDTSGKYKDGSPQFGIQDEYRMNFSVVKTTEFAGKIVRQPNIFTKGVLKRVQGAALGFDITLSVLNPKDLKQKKTIGKWVGNLPINTETGAFELAGGIKEERPLRISVDAVGKAAAFEDRFSGRLVGKAEKKETLAQYSYKRLIGNKEVTVTVKRSDPMRFDGIELAKGPAEIYPRTVVNGRLDYDYETGNWLTDGIRFNYALNGREIEDVVTGTIKWVEDPQRDVNGKGYYEFNLRFNEAKHKTQSTESDAFAAMSEEDAFFAVDDTVPTLKGRIEFVDTKSFGSDLPSNSKVTYNLHANKLTKQQVMNFFKLWIIAIGPTNDE